ncbi:hypothetical protein FRC19_008106 [Serendipita sp. 401]|nr:hypothetical protein FRC19_008106 [Serendipita sp. 401]
MSMIKTLRKITNSRRLVQDDGSDEDHDPTPKPKSRTKKAPPPTTKPIPSSLLDVLNSSIPEIIGPQSKASTRSSQPSKRRDQVQSLTKSSVSNGKPDTSKTIDTATARRFLFSMKPDVLSEEEDALEEMDPYMALRETIGLGSSRPLSRLQDATERPTPGPAGSSKSRTASQPIAGGRGRHSLHDDEPMEDFSHLFADDVTPLEASHSVNSSQSSQSSQSVVAKRTNRFVHSDTDEDEGLVTRKAPKRSTKQVSPPRRTEMRDARTNPRIPDTRSGLSSASEKATNNRPKLASQANASSSQQRLSTTEVIDLSDSEDDIEMISALQTSRPGPASQATKRAKVTKVSKSAADVSIIDLD